LRAPRSKAKSPLIELLFGAYRRSILGLLLLHPEQSFYVREIARLTGVPAGSLHRELGLLGDAGLLERSMAGNQVRYQADRACPVYDDLANLFRKTAGLADVLRDSLAPLGKKVRMAFIFGSTAQGKEGAASDIDLMVIGSASLTQVVEALAGTSARLRREVNPVAMKPEAFRSKAKARDRFVSRIIREPKIFLVGDATELGELAKDRAA